jgi:hypothetical protein
VAVLSPLDGPGRRHVPPPLFLITGVYSGVAQYKTISNYHRVLFSQFSLVSSDLTRLPVTCTLASRVLALVLVSTVALCPHPRASTWMSQSIHCTPRPL